MTLVASRVLCSVEDCSRPLEARGWCATHYRRWLRWGDPLREPASPVQTLPDHAALGLSYRQLDYWTSQGYLKANDPNPGCGRRRSWPQVELDVAQRMARMVGAGLTVKAAHRAARHGGDLGAGVIVRLDPEEHP